MGGSFRQWGNHPLLGLLKVSWNCHGISDCIFSLQIEDQGLVEFDLSAILDPFDFNWFILCPWAMSFFQKLCPAPSDPVSCSFLETCPGQQCCLYNLLTAQPENSWPLGGKYCIISNPSRYSSLHLPCFPQHVQQQNLLVNQRGGVGVVVAGTQMPARSPSVGGIPSRATGLPGTKFDTLRISPMCRLGPNPYRPSLKVTNIHLDQISTLLL